MRICKAQHSIWAACATFHGSTWHSLYIPCKAVFKCDGNVPTSEGVVCCKNCTINNDNRQITNVHCCMTAGTGNE